jgi:uncharacterized protein
MTHSRRLPHTIALLAWALVLSGCASLMEPPVPPPPPRGEPSPAKPPPRPTVTRGIIYAPQVTKIALLLPLSGRMGGAAASVREGFLTSYYQSPASQRPRVRIYDTANISANEAISTAVSDGAELIVGPLTRDEVTAAADFASPRPPLLALNFLPVERVPPEAFYQFALSPEDEAREVAKRVIADGRRRGIVLVPEGDWGTRVLNAFEQELIANGGFLLGKAAFDATRTDYSDEITQVLRISDSHARKRRLESILGTKLQFEPRRRQDIEFIFAASQPNIARLLRPQLKFHYAGDIPTYATSDSFEPDPTANEDLEGLIFPDMPWILGGEPADSVRSAARDAWPTGGPRRNRLFAFGYDAYRLAMNLRGGKAVAFTLDGVTGRLTLDANRKVQRQLDWAQLRGGQPRPLPPVTASN